MHAHAKSVWKALVFAFVWTGKYDSKTLRVV